MSGRRSPPPLPPRSNGGVTPSASEMPSFHQDVQSTGTTRIPESLSSSSLASILPTTSESSLDKRTLLLIYIHGFMGNETSFQSFPAHVHNVIAASLADTHIVCSKIYPKYRSRQPIEYARDNFSQWLESIENPNTDVILLGHSMGGLLSAEVALLRTRYPFYGQAFRHRILGTISFDTPFLGMHPGVILSGIGSLFRPDSGPSTPSPETDSNNSENFKVDDVKTTSDNGLGESSSTSFANVSIDSISDSTLPMGAPQETPLNSAPLDLNFNPPFPTDVRLPVRSSLDNALHFVTKHYGGLTVATKRYVMSHLQFGACLADYSSLQSRYQKIRELERIPDHDARPRVRFVNYYTASTGRLAKGKQPPPEDLSTKENESPVTAAEAATKATEVAPSVALEQGIDTLAISANPQQTSSASLTESFEQEEASKEEVSEDSQVLEDMPEEPLTLLEPLPIEDNHDELVNAMQTSVPNEEDIGIEAENSNIPSQSPRDALPPLPPRPQEPPAFDGSLYSDIDTRKLAEKEHGRDVKAYQRALKDREKARKEREKLVQKREKKARQELEKQLKLEKKQKEIREKEQRKKDLATAAASDRDSRSGHLDEHTKSTSNKEKKKKDKKFCMLPPKVNGQRDPTWIRVHMEGVDEVGAHCGLFFLSKTYEQLVGDVASRIEEWVREDLCSKETLSGKE
ncbi:hypothetical protein L228DRAFT_90431 [Xylona heveae TC161]|uniref:DUF676 domain-containing protein n=1 Tax=Xylona heveae (strain CBS 132557 / TC161) TaxID=1328760 RepID=A0A161TPK1_XYLHT|nr:hypothetical protein L228DRAFT_90431 [Xylona heveae TC161]KZF24146.1 hypothetical protein L228DRAFT_90431 [Xylona heveae TC161]